MPKKTIGHRSNSPASMHQRHPHAWQTTVASITASSWHASTVSQPAGRRRLADPLEEKFLCRYFAALSCLGGNKNATAQCNEGFVGTACSVCDEGYYKFVGNCVKCEDGFTGKLINILLLVCLVALWVGINHFLSSSLESVDVFLAFSQMTAVIGRFDVPWPEGISSGSNGYVFRAANFLDFDVDIVNFGEALSQTHSCCRYAHLQISAGGFVASETLRISMKGCPTRAHRRPPCCVVCSCLHRPPACAVCAPSRFVGAFMPTLTVSGRPGCHAHVCPQPRPYCCRLHRARRLEMGFLPSAELAVGDSDVLFLESCVVRTGNSSET